MLVLRMPVNPVGGLSCGVLPKTFGWTSCWSTEHSQPNCVPLMPFNIMCFFPDLLSPLSHGGPTSVLWVLLETGGFSSSVLHSWESQTLTVLPFLHQRGLHPLIQLRAVLPWGRDSTGKVLFSVSSVSKHVFFFVCFFFFTSGVLE